MCVPQVCPREHTHLPGSDLLLACLSLFCARRGREREEGDRCHTSGRVRRWGGGGSDQWSAQSVTLPGEGQHLSDRKMRLFLFLKH